MGMHNNRADSEELENIRLENVKQPQKTRCDDKYKSYRCPKDFDDVLEIVGSVGTYQRFILYAILFPISAFESIFTMNLWFLMDEPNHWCNVPPGRDKLGLDLDTWKNLTIPRTENGQFSKCTMFNSTSLETTECTSGWEYDFSVTNYRSILVDYNWVCNKSHLTTLVHTATNMGRALGTILLGFLADKVGRKPVFIITLVLFSFGRATSLFFVHDIRIFATLALITGMSAPMFAISINTIAVELSGKEYRAWIYSFTWMTVVIGMVIVPCIALISPNWFIFGWATILIGSLTYLFLPWIPESPRWLLSMGRVDEVFRIVKNIAYWNGTDHKFRDEELREILNDIGGMEGDHGEEEEEDKSIFRLFSHKRLALHTLLITFTWVMNGLIFHGLNLNSLNLHGHRYLNFFLVILMEVPGGLFGGILCDKFGRRWMQTLFFLVSGVACSVAAYGSSLDVENSVGASNSVIVASNIAKFAITMSFLVIYLQAVELFPTPLRTTGSGLASTTSSIAVILVPFIVYTGKSSVTTPWVVSAVMSVAGMVSASFIPETMNHNLPETLEAAANFGKGRKFWSFHLPKARHSQTTTSNES